MYAIVLLFMCIHSGAQHTATPNFINIQPKEGDIPLVSNSVATAVLFDSHDHQGVLRAIKTLQEDFSRLGASPGDVHAPHRIIIGTLGSSAYIDKLIALKKIDGGELFGATEKFIIQHVAEPGEGIASAIVIAGSDKRGTIYGIYELSRQMGISPWYYWADVPVIKQANLYFNPGIYTAGEPKVRYRGIFLNDEAPALSGWSKATFGGFNSQFYEKVFELLLRLKANFLWPAMWGSAFYDDDPANGALADEMGIVISTSHHEPMARAQQEWKRHGNGGSWDYTNNSDGLRSFWRGGMERTKNWETVVTLAMRGDGDEPMSEEQDVKLLQQIVKDQRKIIAEVTGKKAEQKPQVWALYKEVQDYYDKGMRVPEDVTLLFCDDNWGNVRKLPALDAKPRKGGYGMYYHFDYVGAPRNSKWVNVSQIQRVWEQMNLTYRHGVNRIWVVNVGDLKPMEFPISFFLDMAWDPDRFHATNLLSYTKDWAEQQFGKAHAHEIARLLDLYTKYNHRVTPELLDHRTFSLNHYNEFQQVVDAYKDLLLDAMRLYNMLPDAQRDAYDQLVLFPINACANLYEMYLAKAKNDWYYQQKDLRANYWADQVKLAFGRDSLLTDHFNNRIAGGKWKHMMDQVRIGYTSWNDPARSIMPKIHYVDSTLHTRDKIFIEKDGVVAIEAMNFHDAKTSNGIVWTEIPNLGKTHSAVTTMPVTHKLGDDTYLEYKMAISTIGEGKLMVLTSPTLNYNANQGLRYAVSINGGAEQVININGHYRGELGQWQARRIIENQSTHQFSQAGEYSVRIRPLEQGIVIQKIILDMGGRKPSYLGPPESKQKDTLLNPAKP
ncbi:hypothetical protein GCM10017764_18040 [Sphingobacterium griseoflavum]|uniref:Gylcosyl hydrolase 115 C-terminal domain-containing protein n=2 Tax=Sphingobacterium griseoflavum TaxID=1474952 RepID=A0ABQ3HU84_9SPHI|nr:hypothetical protein GCM10017764_18040 [Sphingobacterium griseoflavum]